MTTTEAETGALEAMLAHHRALDEGVGVRAAAVARATAAGGAYGPEVAELVAYLASEVLPHALAEEHTVYQAAGALEGLADTVAGMVAEHRHLTSATEELADTSGTPDPAGRSGRIAALFSEHVAKENDLLLPALLADDHVDLAQLLVQMHRLTEAAREEHPFADDDAEPDPEAAISKLLLEAANELAEAGREDRACRVAASAWAVLRVPRPDLAVRITAALHRLAKRVSEEPVAFRSPGDRPAAGATSATADPDLDVRSLAPARRHESIFAAYHALSPGSGFVLVNDHDPKPLRYQFAAEHEGEFTWDSIEAGPEVWRVRIGKPAAGAGAPGVAGGGVAGEGGGGGGGGGGEEPELDVRRLVHGQRHEIIFATYAGLAPGAGFVLVNDHDPKPLRYQLQAQHEGEFTWDYLAAGPDVWRVRIGRVPA